MSDQVLKPMFLIVNIFLLNIKRFEPRLDMPVREGEFFIFSVNIKCRLVMAIKYLLGTDKDAASLELALSRLGFDIKVNPGQHTKSLGSTS